MVPYKLPYIGHQRCCLNYTQENGFWDDSMFKGVNRFMRLLDVEMENNYTQENGFWVESMFKGMNRFIRLLDDEMENSFYKMKM